MPDAAIKNWIPYKLTRSPDGLRFHWLNTFGAPFDEPFFAETITKCRALAAGHHFASVSDVEMIRGWSADIDFVEPAAFIFHVSRCGSTLISQLLGIPKEHIVLAEVPIFDEILGLGFKDAQITPGEITALFSASMKFYGQPKTGSEKRLFVKTDSWHIFYYQQLRRLYPSVPFVFIYRRPTEVFASLIKRPGIQAVPGLVPHALLGFSPEEITYDRQDISRVLERYLQRCIEIATVDRLSLFLDYADGVMPMLEKTMNFTRTTFSENDLKLARDRSLYHGKRPSEHFALEMPVDTPDFLSTALSLYDKLREIR